MPVEEAPTWLSILNIGGILVAVVMGIFMAVQKWIPQKGHIENQQIAALQKSLDAEREENGRRDEKMEGLNKRLDEVARHNRELQRRDFEWFRWRTMNEIGIQNGTVPPMLPLPEMLSAIWEADHDGKSRGDA